MRGQGARITLQPANLEKGHGKGNGSAGDASPGGAGNANPAAAAGPMPSDSLFIRGLPVAATSEDVRSIFGQYGTILSCHVMPDSLGEAIALVKMADIEKAKWMVAKLNGKIPQGLEKATAVAFVQAPALQKSALEVADLVGKGAMTQGLLGACAASRYCPYDGRGSTLSATNGWSPSLVTLPSGQTVYLPGVEGLAAVGLCGAQVLSGKGFKTKLCSYFTDRGVCPTGDACTFAHGSHEIKGFKSRMCKFTEGQCPQGDKCSFAHSGEEVKGFKTKMCRYEFGKCPSGDKCSFAHGPNELQQDPAVTAALVQLCASGALLPALAVAGSADPAMAATIVGLLGALGSSDLTALATLGVDLSAVAGFRMPDAADTFVAAAAAAAGAVPAALADVAGGKGGPKGYKTRLCSYFKDTGACPKGPKCTFAHGPEEVHGYKTRMCKWSHMPGECPDGDKCVFAHHPSEMPPPS